MKQSDVVVGKRYNCKVSGRLVAVEVTHRITSRIGNRIVTRFRVRRVDSGRDLPKNRTAADLREIVTLRQYALYRDGKKLFTAPEGDIYRWIHSNHSYSVSHALEHEGYSMKALEQSDLAE